MSPLAIVVKGPLLEVERFTLKLAAFAAPDHSKLTTRSPPRAETEVGGAGNGSTVAPAASGESALS
jgi:hypothetical protein